MAENVAPFDWNRIEAVSGRSFDANIRTEIASNARWYEERSGDYADDASSKDFLAALKALSALSKSEFSRFRLEPIEDELATVEWYLDVMSQERDEAAAVNARYFFYFRIWHCIGKAGVSLTRGKGIPNNKLSLAQRVFREVCSQVGITFSSDQALADALKRALKAGSTGAK